MLPIHFPAQTITTQSTWTNDALRRKGYVPERVALLRNGAMGIPPSLECPSLDAYLRGANTLESPRQFFEWCKTNAEMSVFSHAMRDCGIDHPITLDDSTRSDLELLVAYGVPCHVTTRSNARNDATLNDLMGRATCNLRKLTIQFSFVGEGNVHGDEEEVDQIRSKLAAQFPFMAASNERGTARVSDRDRKTITEALLKARVVVDLELVFLPRARPSGVLTAVTSLPSLQKLHIRGNLDSKHASALTQIAAKPTLTHLKLSLDSTSMLVAATDAASKAQRPDLVIESQLTLRAPMPKSAISNELLVSSSRHPT